MVEYDVVTASSPSELAIILSRCAKDGWIDAGDMRYNHTDCVYFILVKRYTAAGPTETKDADTQR